MKPVLLLPLTLAIILVVFVALAGCTAGNGSPATISPTPTLTPALVPPGGQAVSTSPAMTPDLTNQNSPLAATLTTPPSHTTLTPGTQGVGLKLVAGGFDAPMVIVSPDDGSGRMFVVEQAGIVKIIRPDGSVSPDPFLDLRDRMIPLSGSYDERGLLSIAFHPDFRNNSRVYAYYSAPLQPGAPAGWSCTNHLSEFTVPASSPDRADPASEKILLSVDKPYQNHNGGTILFGPEDGYLYLPLGDGGRADDTGMGHTPLIGNGQDLTKFLGKVIRIDVDKVSAGKSYGIPADNPFVGNATVAPEIFAYGFRNPAFASFDSGDDHHLFIANAGQALFESAFIVMKGGDYGWNIREGTHCFDPNNDTVPPVTCPITGLNGEPLIGPIVELGHDVGNTIVGGAVYRGTAIPGWQGKYVFGTWSTTSFTSGDGALLIATPPSDFSLGTLPDSARGLTPEKNLMWSTQRITITGNANGEINAFVRGIDEGPDHELYVLVNHSTGPTSTLGTGEIWKFVPA